MRGMRVFAVLVISLAVGCAGPSAPLLEVDDFIVLSKRVEAVSSAAQFCIGYALDGQAIETCVFSPASEGTELEGQQARALSCLLEAKVGSPLPEACR